MGSGVAHGGNRLFFISASGGIQAAAERILVAAKEAKEKGETRWRFWFQDAGYLDDASSLGFRLFDLSAIAAGHLSQMDRAVE